MSGSAVRYRAIENRRRADADFSDYLQSLSDAELEELAGDEFSHLTDEELERIIERET